MNRQIVTFSVQFQREEKSEWEEGIYVGRHDNDGERGQIFDMDCNSVKGPIWNYRDRFYRGFAIFREEQ
jgi:hypothetical protein